ncbi:transformation system, type II secretion system ATPase CtsE [Campylobacter pinnipediorum subsp. pinnipediorum]|uniref:GspE/PulE family protein n=1 Tax=Campylobacter pinnipediorum TaxID=1965231 RepID=UPI000995205C|nr:GspE/PulE family protein [Campylobacter pinnipediorum]AQW81185.1 transformation system, type II secretion system ATPase CtsE [Campylobacter pinnipediorum subsp. pinnipediorum]AQW84490.1 transformation system, type II secretion system ATPase CtsE [Campylobacter pinnipediorum subsp. pinnipediorum]
MNSTENILFKHLLDNQKITKEIDETTLQNQNLSLVDILIKNNLIDEETLIMSAVELYRRNRLDISSITNDIGIIIDDFLKIISREFNLELFDLDNVSIDYRISEKIGIAKIKNFEILPIKEDEINVYVIFKNPFDIITQDKVQNLFNRKLLKVAIANPSQIDKFINKLELNESIRDLIIEIRKELSSSAINNQADESSGILKLIEVILKTSIQSRASDIHIEPTETNCIVRSRIDGLLTETFIFDKDIYPPMVSRMKLLSNMDIAERRKPQDGRFSAQILDKEYDFRISTLPILNGESIVLRILDKSKVVINLENLGMHPENFDKFKKAMKAPYGIILVTGPTGSGKTTTLYAALNDIKSVDTKIITVEDPVEYQLNLIQQVHVNEKAGLNFSSALRSILRQDPDIIMIGEIRDQETLRIAIQAALTGHLVFSTLHTNDAISALPRIIDMGIEPYLVSGALVGIEAQRLVRKLCPHCKQKINLSKTAMKDFENFLPQEYQFYTNVGCEHCSGTGYIGREMISEILPISDHIQNLVANSATKEEIRKVAYEEGFIDMFKDGILRAARGITTIEEVYRVAKA